MLLPHAQIVRITKDLKFWEGERPVPYKDSLGIWTWGIGHNLAKPICIESLLTLTSPVWVEYNARMTAAMERQIEYDMRESYDDVEVMLDLHHTDASFFRTEMLVHAMFQLGSTRLAKFKKFWANVQDETYDRAAMELIYRDGRGTALANQRSLEDLVTDPLPKRDGAPIHSLWYEQTPTRCAWVARGLMFDEWEDPSRT